MRCINKNSNLNSFYKFTGLKKHFSILFFVYVAIVLFCNYTLGIFHLTDVEYHKSFDTYSYIDAAKLILNGMKAHSLRCFGYAGFLAFPYSLFKLTPAFFWVVYIIQNILLLLSFQFIYKIIAFYTNDRKAFWAVLLLLINITYVVFAFHVMTEIGFLYLMVGSFYCIHLYFDKQQSVYLLLSFLAICIATLFRPGMLYFNIICGIILCLYFIVKKKNRLAFIFSVVLFFTTIGFQAYKMKQQYGLYKISFIDDVTMYRYLNTAIVAKLQGKDKLYLMGERDRLLFMKLEKMDAEKLFEINHEIVKKETSDLLKNHTFNFIFVFAENLVDNFHTGNTFIRDMPENKIIDKEIRKRLFDYTRIWNMLFVVAMVLFNIFLIIKIFGKKIEVNNAVFLSFILLFYCNYCFITSGISYFQGDRFNVIWMPMFLLSIMLFFSKKKIWSSSL
jgi:hypothetical protein